MALRKTLAKRLFDCHKMTSPAVALESLHAVPPPPNAAQTTFHRDYLASPDHDTDKRGFFWRFLQRRALNHASSVRLAELLSLPVGEKLRDKLRSTNGLGVAGDNLLLGGLSRSPPEPAPADFDPFLGVSVRDARKLLRLAKVEMIKARLREISASTISYEEFIKICGEACGCEDQGVEFAKTMDEAGNVIVLGNVVFLRPEQVAKSIGALIYQSMAMPDDPRRGELEQMEKQKALIDEKAQAQVRAELYCGLGFLIAQTLGFMRLTFWELSWDVMEPICFFVTSLHFALAYGFFLRTSKEPSFEGYFQRRFRTKQEKLMRIHGFDAGRYHELCRAFYPDRSGLSKRPVF